MNDIYSIKQGILQRFIPSKGDRYNVYRCTWSSHMCFFEKIENKWLMNSKVDLYQKIITYEDTNAHVSISCLQGKTLINKIETLAYDIVSHLKNVSIGKLDIGRMQMIFLMNHKEQLYMLGCTSIRLMHHKRQNFSEKQMLRPIFDQDIVCLPQKIDRYGLNSVIAEDLRKEFSCVYCEEQFNTSNLHEVTFKNIIQGKNDIHIIQLLVRKNFSGIRSQVTPKRYNHKKKSNTSSQSSNRNSHNQWIYRKTMEFQC